MAVGQTEGVEALGEIEEIGPALKNLVEKATSPDPSKRHRTVEEIWYIVSGQGEMWRRQGNREEIVALGPGLCLTIPVDTQFQYRSTGPEPLAVIAITMPPWPGDDEAYEVAGRWKA